MVVYKNIDFQTLYAVCAKRGIQTVHCVDMENLTTYTFRQQTVVQSHHNTYLVIERFGTLGNVG